ncbi:hypothetical protein [Neobacillus vireti]|uniref:Lipoprotein n=1 Tax=Neobacillus vireti LMG 21834 TaxID=1131730 RepID=A0AB94IV09_9BACI|nr:hypothetical protein [Neobacillus vireti]ETI70793.1 hypothetical protein BAVI_00300 [Neobacillus vireti LMG 21834]KLT17665.1 hypothetical protein AA980_11140 [Neobacillus vireti]
MKRYLLSSIALTLSASLFGCSHTEKVQEQAAINLERHQQKIIIRNNVNDPLPPEAQDIDAMPNNSGPQLIPKADPNKPIVITKMPYSNKNNGNSTGSEINSR